MRAATTRDHEMTVTVRTDRDGQHAHLVAEGPFDLAHATEVAHAVGDTQPSLVGCQSLDVDLELSSGDTLAKLIQDTHASIENTRVAVENTRVAIEDTRAAIREANLSATTESAREAMERTGDGSRCSAAFAAGDTGVAGADARSRAAARVAAGVDCLWSSPYQR
jgi:hypothetical protein